MVVSIYIICYLGFVKPKQHAIIVTSLDPITHQRLHSKYADTLSCPCAKIIIPYDVFVSNTIETHPVCSSDFVDKKWIEALYLHDSSSYGTGDFRTTASKQVNALNLEERSVINRRLQSLSVELYLSFSFNYWRLSARCVRMQLSKI